jgi:hypothetical protein
LSGVVGDKDENIGTLIHCNPKNGVWIDEFKSVDNSEYIITTDEFILENFNLSNPAVYEDIEEGVFRFKSGTKNGGSGVNYFTVEIPLDHKDGETINRRGRYKVTDDSDNKVKFYTGNSYDDVRNLDLTVELGSLHLIEGWSSQVKVYGNFEMKNADGVFVKKYLSFRFEFEI